MGLSLTPERRPGGDTLRNGFCEAAFSRPAKPNGGRNGARGT
jgi:hypothetical protein